jgi:hypothetical protein
VTVLVVSIDDVPSRVVSHFLSICDRPFGEY